MCCVSADLSDHIWGFCHFKAEHTNYITFCTSMCFDSVINIFLDLKQFQQPFQSSPSQPNYYRQKIAVRIANVISCFKTMPKTYLNKQILFQIMFFNWLLIFNKNKNSLLRRMEVQFHLNLILADWRSACELCLAGYCTVLIEGYSADILSGTRWIWNQHGRIEWKHQIYVRTQGCMLSRKPRLQPDL